MQERVPQTDTYRERAEECRKLAETAPAGGMREGFLRLAEVYEQLAATAEARRPPKIR
jgi:hypothetical protein